MQYVKVNYFQDCRVISECNLPSSLEDNRFDAGWHRIVQADISQWIPSYYLIEGLVAFIASEDDNAFDDCKGMCHFYVAKYCIKSGTGVVSIIPKNSCPPFAGQIDNFRKLWSVDFCQQAFNTIRHIRQEMQKFFAGLLNPRATFRQKMRRYIFRVVLGALLRMRWLTRRP